MAEEAYHTEQQALKQFGSGRGKKIFKEIGLRVKRDWTYIKQLKYIPQKVYPSFAKSNINVTFIDDVGFTLR